MRTELFCCMKDFECKVRMLPEPCEVQATDLWHYNAVNDQV